MFGLGKKKKKAEAARRAAEEQAAAEARAAEEARAAAEARAAEEARLAAEAAKKAKKKAPAKKKEEAPVKDEAPAAPVKRTAKKATAVKAEETAEAAPAPAPMTGARFEIKRTSDGKYVFNVRAANTQIIAKSQTYSSMAACKNGIASVGANAAIAAIEDQTLQTINEERCPKFQIYYDKAGQFRFNLIATNGQNILSCTQGYTQKASCKNGIRSVITNANAPIEIVREEK